jgi:L-amino acid N-acyltransferase YncA
MLRSIRIPDTATQLLIIRNEMYIIRLAEEKDYQTILAIYTPFIIETAFTFDCDVPSLAEFSKKVEHTLLNFPWLVCELDNRVVGYAYASKHRDRSAYEWSAESSVYVSSDLHQKGVGRSLYAVLFELLNIQGLVNVYAGITLPNIKSEKFHETIGFRTVGTYSNIGYKLGHWHSVKWMELSLSKHSDSPRKPIPFSEIRSSDKCVAALGRVFR